VRREECDDWVVLLEVALAVGGYVVLAAVAVAVVVENDIEHALA